MTTTHSNYIILYTGIKKEIIFYKKGIENILELYTENGLDITTYFHQTNHLNLDKAYFICPKNKTHTILFNNEPFEIPIDMNVAEFQFYINCYDDIHPVIKTTDTTVESYAAYFLDETFTTNKKYTNDFFSQNNI